MFSECTKGADRRSYGAAKCDIYFFRLTRVRNLIAFIFWWHFMNISTACNSHAKTKSLLNEENGGKDPINPSFLCIPLRRIFFRK